MNNCSSHLQHLEYTTSYCFLGTVNHKRSSLRLPLESISEQEFSQRAVPREREKKKLFASMKSYFRTEKERDRSTLTEKSQEFSFLTHMFPIRIPLKKTQQICSTF
jgi:hypothetical protein